MDILYAKKAHTPVTPASPSKRITSSEIVPADAQANDIALDEGNFMISSAPHAEGFEGVGLADDQAENPYDLVPGLLDSTMPPQPFVHPFGGASVAATEVPSPMPEAGPSTSTSGHESGKGPEKVDSTDEESSDSSSDSDDDSDDD